METDKAWEKLQTRLEQEGLTKTFTLANSRTFPYNVFKWVAAILLIGGGIGAFLLMSPHDNNPEQIADSYLTLHNEKGAVTLVKTLEDGSTIYLGANTELTYPESFEKDKREVALKGNAFFEVTGNKKRPFLIHTSHTDIEVIGTAFEIRNPDKETFELAVFEGEVKVSFIPKENRQSEGSSRYVRAGESITISSRGEWQDLSDVKSELLYRSGISFRFKNEQVGDIIRVINKNTRQSEFISIDESLENHRLTVSFSNQTLEEIAEILSLAVGSSWQRQNDMLLISD